MGTEHRLVKDANKGMVRINGVEPVDIVPEPVDMVSEPVDMVLEPVDMVLEPVDMVVL